MPNEARLAVERAISKLINRFGTDSEVIGELENAVALLKKTEAVAVVEPTPPAVEEATATVQPEAEPPPKKTHTGYGRKKK